MRIIHIKTFLKNFELYPIANVSNLYIKIKSQKEWRQKLNDVIEDRFKQLNENSFNESDDLTHISTISDEISYLYPSIDSDFYDECNNILNKIAKRTIFKNNNNFISELQISSENNLKYLREVINGQIYWKHEKINYILKSHEEFLREECYSIVMTLYPKNYCELVLDFNRSILENQIEKDRKVLQTIFQDLANKSSISYSDKTIDSTNKMKVRTNYSIRETKRVIEITMIIEKGKLEKEIEQDF